MNRWHDLISPDAWTDASEGVSGPADGAAEGAAEAQAAEDPADAEADSPEAPPVAPEWHAGAAPTDAAVVPDSRVLIELIGQVVERDEQALAQLYVLTSARVFGLVLRITRCRAWAEEVLEETYWQVWRQAPRFDVRRGAPLAWLLAMARSRAIDAMRSNQRFEHEALDDDMQAARLDEAAHLPQDLLDATRSGARLHEALLMLAAQPRQLLALAFFRGLTHEEIAMQTGLALGTVKSQIRRSLQQLRCLLGDDGTDEPPA